MSNAKPARIFTFSDVAVYITPDNEKIVEWSLHPRFEFKSVNIQFYVEQSRSSGEWTRLNPDDPITNMCVYLDETKYRCSP